MPKEDKDPNEGFIDEFKRISQEPILREYEKKNRERINEASLIVRDAFDQLWKKNTGNNYYQPTTTVQPPRAAFGINDIAIDPRSRKYRAQIVFQKIFWQKLRRKISKRFRDLYTLEGETNGSKRPIFQNLDIDRLKEILGEKPTEQIRSVKDTDHGEIDGTFDLLVEGYWEVEFAPTQNDQDKKNVELTWEGQCLVMQRQIPVVLPGFYIEVADNSIRETFTQTDKSGGRKKVGVIQAYPYTVRREATREEYLTQKRSGDRVMKEKIRRDESI